MKNLILNKLKYNDNIVEIVSPHWNLVERFCVDFIISLSQNDGKTSNGSPQNVLLFMNPVYDKERDNNFIQKTISKNIIQVCEDEFSIPIGDEFIEELGVDVVNKFKSHNIPINQFSHELFEKYMEHHDIRLIYIDNSTLYLYYNSGVREYLIENEILMIYYNEAPWEKVELKDNLIYIDKYEESKYSISYREIKRELISKVVTEDFLTI